MRVGVSWRSLQSREHQTVWEAKKAVTAVITGQLTRWISFAEGIRKAVERVGQRGRKWRQD